MYSPIKIVVSSRAKVGTACGFAVIGLTAAAMFTGLPAFATPGSGFTPSPQSVGTFAELDVKADKTGHWDLFLKTKDKSTIGVDVLTVNTSGFSGWHTHTGVTLVTVKQGQVAVKDGVDCSTKVYQAGEGFVEPANHVHMVTNPYGLTAVLVAIQMRPFGTPPRVDAPAPTNCT